MSVTRKRSYWAWSAGLVAGLAAMSLAGCGGGDDTGFPPSQTPQLPPAVISVPVSITPPSVQAQNPTPVVTGQGATVTSATVKDTTQTGGVTSAKVVIPPNSVGSNQTLAIEVVPSAQSTIARLKQSNPSAVQGITPIADVVFGPVDANGKIDPKRPVVFGGSTTLTIGLGAGQTASIAGLVANGGKLVVRRVNPSTGSLDVVSDCTPSVDTTNNQIVLTGSGCSGALSVTVDTPFISLPPIGTTHRQGGIG